jgi:hypothetical protein
MTTNNYSRRKNTLTKKDKFAMSKWGAQQPNRDAPFDRVRIWEKLNAYLARYDARIISPMHCYPIRFEMPPVRSDLPLKLTELGYTVIYRCEETRVGGPASPEYQARWRYRRGSAGYGQYTVAVFELHLPQQAPGYVAGQSKIAVQ